MNHYRIKTEAELRYIAKDAHEAAQCMKGMDLVAECKYLDQVNDACTELYRRQQLAAATLPNTKGA
jgi:hypothetical protein